MFKYFLYKLALFIIDHLPEGLSYRFGMFISDLQYCFSFRDRKIVYNNLKVIMGPRKDLHRLTREVFRNFGRYLVEFFLMEKQIDDHFLENRVRVKGLHHLKKALDKENGAIILTAHMGNWELGAALFSKLGYELMAIALPHRERPVNDLFNYQREVQGITVVPTSIALRNCVATLYENKLVALVGDRDFQGNGEVMDFLGKKTLIPKGPAILSGKTGAPIIPTFLIREKDGKFLYTFGEPIFPPDKAKEVVDQKTLHHIMKRYLHTIEKQIRQNPTQWLMFRKFWIDPEPAPEPSSQTKQKKNSSKPARRLSRE